jgi:methylene-tetrahydromethanopterin dehydrogenase
MENRYILHFLTPTRHASPFDVNMALDAGYDAVMTYTQVTIDDVTGLTQDAIFSRGPSGVKRTGLFIGGREVDVAHEMLETAQAAMVPPFEASVFADPSGAYTTAAAMVSEVERQLKAGDGAAGVAEPAAEPLAGLKVVVWGIGPVGACVSVLAASAGADVRIVSHNSEVRARSVAAMCTARFGAQMRGVCAADPAQKRALVADCHVLLACGKAGVRVFGKEELAAARELRAAADVNAVPPEGIEGIGLMDRGKPLAAGSGRAIGIGALAIGNIKYKVQRGLFEDMLRADKPVYYDFRNAFALARRLSA